VLDVTVAEVMLNGPRVLAVVRQLVAGGMAQHVGVDRERDAGVATGPPHDLADGIGRQRRFALTNEHVRRLWVVPL